MYYENYKMLMKKTEDDTSRWKDILCSWIRRITIVNKIILPKAIYRFNANPINLHNSYQITNGIFDRTKTNKFLTCMKTQRLWIAKAILKKKNRTGGIWLPGFRKYYKDTVAKQYGTGTKTDA